MNPSLMNYLMKKPLPPLLSIAMFATALDVSAQSNLVSNGSFENSSDVWSGGNFAVHVNEAGAADGRNYVDLYVGGTIAQDVPTISNRSYIVRFAIDVNRNDLRVLWNGVPIGEVNFTSSPYQQWIYTNFVGTATSSVSQVTFQEVSGTSTFDAVSVGWRDEPPTITTQVPSRSTFAGGTVTFPVVPSGGPPLAYQWYFNDVPLTDATNRILTITNALVEAAGNYWVTITNSFGQVSSLPASLVVQPIPDLPLIVYQPKSLQTTAGYFAGFYVFAVGAAPLHYYWKFKETDIPGATDSHFSIPTVATSDAGDYSVVVSNDFGSVESLPATLSVVNGYGGGVVVSDNYNPPFVDAPIFDVALWTKRPGRILFPTRRGPHSRCAGRIIQRRYTREQRLG